MFGFSKVTFLFFLAVTTAAFGTNFKREVPQPLERAFIPQGFDNDDGIEFVVAGYLPSSCWKVGPVSTQLDAARKVIYVQTTSYEYSGDCLTAKIPFFMNVHVGWLKNPGNYAVIDLVSRKQMGWLGVTQSPTFGSGVDSEIYPPLQDAFFSQHMGRASLVLRGIMPQSCLKVGKVDIRVQSDVVVVVPRLEKKPGESCDAGSFPFAEAVPLTHQLPQGVFLLHVRSMGGRAINKIVAGRQFR